MRKARPPLKPINCYAEQAREFLELTFEDWERHKKGDKLFIALKGRASGIYNLQNCVRAYTRFLRRRIEEILAQRQAETGDGLKNRLVRARTETIEMENALRRGELLPADVVLQEWADQAGAMRARLLALPTKAAPQVVACNSAAQVKTLLDGMINEALSELSREPRPRNG